ncbi:MAG: hypothetical protein ACE5MB_09415 [Anaerolineae bacterium]
MAKKSRRARRKARKGRRARRSFPRGAPTSTTVSPVAVPREVRVPQEMALPSQRTAVDFREEYYYVYQDLKRIALLAGTMFAVLIILSFVLR